MKQVVRVYETHVDLCVVGDGYDCVVKSAPSFTALNADCDFIVEEQRKQFLPRPVPPAPPIVTPRQFVIVCQNCYSTNCTVTAAYENTGTVECNDCGHYDGDMVL